MTRSVECFWSVRTLLNCILVLYMCCFIGSRASHRRQPGLRMSVVQGETVKEIEAHNQRLVHASDDLDNATRQSQCAQRGISKLQKELGSTQNAADEIQQNRGLEQLEQDLDVLKQQQSVLKQQVRQKEHEKKQTEQEVARLHGMQRNLIKLQNVATRSNKDLLASKPSDFNGFINAVDRLGLTIEFDSRKGKGSHALITLPELKSVGMEKITVTRSMEGRHLRSVVELILDAVQEIQQYHRKDFDLMNIADSVQAAKGESVVATQALTNCSETAKMLRLEIVDTHKEMERLESLKQKISRIEDALQSFQQQIAENERIISEQQDIRERLHYEMFMVIYEAMVMIPKGHQLVQMVLKAEGSPQEQRVRELCEDRLVEYTSDERLSRIKQRYNLTEYSLDSIGATFGGNFVPHVVHFANARVGVESVTVKLPWSEDGDGSRHILFTRSEYMDAARLYYSLFQYSHNEGRQAGDGLHLRIVDHILELSVYHVLGYRMDADMLSVVEKGGIAWDTLRIQQRKKVSLQELDAYLKCPKSQLLRQNERARENRRKKSSQKQTLPKRQKIIMTGWQQIIDHFQSNKSSEILFGKYYHSAVLSNVRE